MKSISVLIPTYKPGQYFDSCLASIQSKSLCVDSFKVYIGLNGDNEPYYSMIKNFLCKYTFNSELIYLDTANVSSTRNKLINISEEQFIAFIDDDDLISENYLEELIQVSDHKHIGVSNFINFKNNIKNQNSNHIGKSFQVLKSKESSKFKSRKFLSVVTGKLISRSMIGSTKFNDRINVGEDSMFMAEISPLVMGVNKVLDGTACYYVNQRSGSVTRRKMIKIKELKRIAYILLLYFRMMLSGKYDKIFIFTRIAATFKHHLKEVIIN